MEKFKKFISYCSDELQLLGYSLWFSLCFIIYGRIFDIYNISAIHRSIIIFSINLSVPAFIGMFLKFKHIFKK